MTSTAKFGPLMTELAKQAGLVFDAIFQHVENPPPTPVANNAEAFVEWTAGPSSHMPATSTPPTQA